MPGRTRLKSTAAYRLTRRHKTTYKTCSRAIRSIALGVRHPSLFLAALVAFGAATPPPDPIPSLATIIQNHVTALADMHLHAATTFECSGTLIGAGLVGTFHEWRSGDNERRDEQLGLRRERIVRTPSAIWITENQEAPHEVTGTGSKRRIVQDFDDSEAFTRGAKDIHFVDRERLPDGRFAYRLMIQSRDGAPFDVLIDSINWLVDEESYSALDGSHEAITFSEYRVVDGVLVPYIRVDSRGGSEPDVVSTVTKVIVGAPIADSTFVPLERAVVEVDKPVSVPLEILSGFPFAIVTIDGK